MDGRGVGSEAVVQEAASPRCFQGYIDEGLLLLLQGCPGQRGLPLLKGSVWWRVSVVRAKVGS